jgi:hypothetical protein
MVRTKVVTPLLPVSAGVTSGFNAGDCLTSGVGVTSVDGADILQAKIFVPCEGDAKLFLKLFIRCLS